MRTATHVCVAAGILMTAGQFMAEAIDAAPRQVVVETRFAEVSRRAATELGLDWARMQAGALAPNSSADDQAWAAFWRHEAGRLGSQMVALRLAGAATDGAPGTQTPAGNNSPPAADPNARFRAAATPEENLARVPAPTIAFDNDYIAKPRPGEPIGIVVDYAKIEAMIHRYPAEPASTVPFIPPIYGAGYAGSGPMPGWHGFGSGPWGVPWPGYIGCGGWRPPWVSSCVFTAPVCYNPFYGGGLSGGFFYRSRHFSAGFGFGF